MLPFHFRGLTLPFTFSSRPASSNSLMTPFKSSKHTFVSYQNVETLTVAFQTKLWILMINIKLKLKEVTLSTHCCSPLLLPQILLYSSYWLWIRRDILWWAGAFREHHPPHLFSKRQVPKLKGSGHTWVPGWALLWGLQRRDFQKTPALLISWLEEPGAWFQGEWWGGTTLLLPWGHGWAAGVPVRADVGWCGLHRSRERPRDRERSLIHHWADSNYHHITRCAFWCQKAARAAWAGAHLPFDAGAGGGHFAAACSIRSREGHRECGWPRGQRICWIPTQKRRRRRSPWVLYCLVWNSLRGGSSWRAGLWVWGGSRQTTQASSKACQWVATDHYHSKCGVLGHYPGV